MERMRISEVFFFFSFLLGLLMSTVVAKNLNDECSQSFTTVAPCLNFVTGKSSAPSSECCNAVTDIRKNDPVCLCYFIQVAHNGSSGLAVGIQVPKVMQLPSSCKLVNSTTSDCPKLLNISPNSSDYAIFTNPSPSPVASENGSSSGSNSRCGPSLTAFMAVAFAIFLCAFPSWIQIFS